MSWTPQSANTATWESANVAGDLWQYDESDIAYDDLLAQYEQFESAQSFTNQSVSTSSFTNQSVS